jgi:hypothetical protein
MILREILQELKRLRAGQLGEIDRLEQVLDRLDQIEENQRATVKRLAEIADDRRSGGTQMGPGESGGAGRNDEWVQKGIDAILGYQVGKKRGDVE